jgi:cytoplasmic iron level regulating protein YaaA (DUF328/UPF0246 family)
MIILIHSSKTMYADLAASKAMTKPDLIEQAKELDKELKSLSVTQIAGFMKISEALARKVQATIRQWSTNPEMQRPAIDSFAGDIYSGLQVGTWSEADREYAQTSLRVLSGLYGVLRPLDGIQPYRLEMGYRLPKAKYSNLYKFWGNAVAETIPPDEEIINLAAVEYSKLVTPFTDETRIITPRFYTISPRTSEPTFVTVHSKIARGAFARWLIVNRVGNSSKLPLFDALGYRYDEKLSTPQSPAYVCQSFGGLGLSVRPKLAK